MRNKVADVLCEALGWVLGVGWVAVVVVAPVTLVVWCIKSLITMIGG